jgi:hypothetical protein
MALGSLMTEEERTAGKKLPVMRQARLVVQGMPRAARVGEFIAMWTIAKGMGKSTAIEDLAEFWGEAPRTMYRRLAEFRAVWAPAGFETPDVIADGLINDYRERKERLNAGAVARLLGAEVELPANVVPSGVTT